MDDDKYKWMTTIRCYTYNHSKFITDALNGFVMQQTNFPFVILLVDDASTDGEQEVIRKYVKDLFDVEDKDVAYEKEHENYFLTYAQHKTNKNCFIAVFYLKVNHYSNPELKGKKREYLSKWTDNAKYEAICEGDDYWTDPLKLQRQVDFLESHKDVTMCFHKVNVLTSLRKDRLLYANLKERYYSGDEIISQWIVPTCSVVAIKEVYKTKPTDSRFIYGDNVLFLNCASKGKVYCINRTMATYRRLDSGTVYREKTLDRNKYIYKKIGHLDALEEYYPQYVKGINKAKMFFICQTLYWDVINLNANAWELFKMAVQLDFSLFVKISVQYIYSNIVRHL